VLYIHILTLALVASVWTTKLIWGYICVIHNGGEYVLLSGVQSL
jgi:hypothetical protein